MNDKKISNTSDYSNKKAATYSLGQISLVTAYQSFTFLIFTFYFTIVGLNVVLITLGFILWSVWNSFNDPMMGHISDRTHTKWGRRRPFIMIALVPLAFIMLLLFTPPISFGISDQWINFIYFVIIIMLFDLFYTMYDINLTSLFPELFITMEERTKANTIRQSFGIIALIFAFILPTLFIPDLSNKKYLPEYQLFGLIVMIIIIIVGVAFLKFSPREKPEFKEDYKNAPSFIEGLKLAGKNKSFMWYIIIVVTVNCVDLILPTLVPLYGKFVLGVGEGESFYLAIMLGLFFISATISMIFIWKPVVQKLGIRKSWFLSMALWIILLAPILFIDNKIAGMIVFFIVGIGFAGCYYLLDLAISDVIDEDEVKTGTRKEATYYGVYILSIRLAAILVFLSISLVFTNVGWTLYEPEKVTPQVIFGLRALMFIFPAIVLSIGMIAVYMNPLHGERLKDVKEKLQKLHEEKKTRL
jgi:GPH family glycoside/pentoside/hexuronide:cation symporter